jgi:hypothetical protein
MRPDALSRFGAALRFETAAFGVLLSMRVGKEQSRGGTS